jgi:hypothetical protein
VEACTITAPVRFGGRAGCPIGRITQSTSDWLILFEPTLSIVDSAKVKRFADGCQCRFSVQTPNMVATFMTGEIC